jgi:lipopolysaccharide/colanic/teichoic acid biosynthesis glycosyltransferase
MRASQFSIYPTSVLLEQMRLEKRRVERTKAPLSIIVLDTTKDTDVIFQFLKSMGSKIRDTDIVGYIDKNKICVLLPDTHKNGAEVVMEKLLGGYNNLFSQAIIASYPDQIFSNILTGNRNSQEFDPLLIDKTNDYDVFFHLGKRCIDILGSITGILIFSPLMLITCLAVKINSPGPVIFKQIRLGRKGKPFLFYKFRSMHFNADDVIHREYVTKLIKGNCHEDLNQLDADKPLYKIKSDPRVTRVGKFIRKTSIDELPQFFNVLRGDMSLVGPRPPLLYEVETYKPWHLRRILDKKPGITGLWQVEGRSRTSFDDMVRLDVQYIKRCSLLLDFKVLLKTVKVVILRVGAV